MEIDEFTKECTQSRSKENINSIITAVSADVVADISVDCLSLSSERVSRIDEDELRKAQQVDEVVGPLYQAVLKKCRPSRKELKLWNKGSRLLLHHFNKLKFLSLPTGGRSRYFV